MKVIVVGCGRVGAALAYQLSKKDHEVTVVDQAAAAFDNLPADFHGRTVEGDVLEVEVLGRAGITETKGLAAVTNSDSVNAVVAYVARTVYHLPNVVVRNYDPRWRPLHEAFGLQVVSSASWSAQRIEELLSDSALRAVFSAGNAEVEIYELVVPAAWEGHCLQELMPEGTCLTVALARAGRATLPSCDTRLEAGDVVYLSSTLEGIEAIRRRLENPAPPEVPAAPEIWVLPEKAAVQEEAVEDVPAPEVMVVPEKAAVVEKTAVPDEAAVPTEAAAPEEE